MARQTRGYAHRVDIRADIAEVWQSLIEPARLARWFAVQARVDAREGGSFRMRFDADFTREAHIDIYQPPRRLRLIYMPMPGLPGDDAVIVDDFLLHSESAPPESERELTILRVLGSGIPDGQEWNALYLRLRSGWERGLLRLKASLEPKAAAGAKPPAAGAKPPAAGAKPVTAPKK
jgi:uncharacterized protein YndB with AHSA1/START domain